MNSNIKPYFTNEHKESIERLIKKTLCQLSKESNHFEYKVRVDLYSGITLDDYFNRIFREIVTIRLKIYSIKNKILLKLFSLNECKNITKENLVINAEIFKKNLIDNIDLDKKYIHLKSLNYLENSKPSKAIQLKLKKYFSTINRKYI